VTCNTSPNKNALRAPLPVLALPPLPAALHLRGESAGSTYDL
jgi:hypothetical protein